MSEKKLAILNLKASMHEDYSKGVFYIVDNLTTYQNYKLIEKYSTAQIAAQERLAAVKARKKKLKREANEKALNRMVADAREMYSTI